MMRFVCDNAKHLVCTPYSLDKLHEMARVLDINSFWFHQDHYDIPIRRRYEIEEVCTKVSSKDIVRIIKGEVNEDNIRERALE